MKKMLGFLLLALCGCRPHEPPVSLQKLATSLAANHLKTEADVQRVVSQAASANRAIMFLHVDWAPMTAQRTQFASFMLDYQQAHPSDDLMFFYVDCTAITDDYAPLKNLNGWSDAEKTGRACRLSGYGELVWLNHGNVTSVAPISKFPTSIALVETTETLLPTKDKK